jgi:hypothetical protein
VVAEVFYKKIGRKYVPISEYHDEFMDSLPYGDHLVSVYPGGTSRRKVDPAFAPAIAATRYGRDVIVKAILDASSMRPTTTPITKGQRNAWNKLAKEFGEEVSQLTYRAAYEVAEEVGDAISKEAEKTLQVPAVKAAYEQFMFVYKLTKDEKSD